MPNGPGPGGGVSQPIAPAVGCRQVLDKIASLAKERDGEVNARAGYALNGQLKTIGEAKFWMMKLQGSAIGLQDKYVITGNQQASTLRQYTGLTDAFYRKWQMRMPYQMDSVNYTFRQYLDRQTVFGANDVQRRNNAMRDMQRATKTAKDFLLHASNEFYCMGIIKYDRVLSTLMNQSLPQNCPANQVAYFKSDVTQTHGRAYYLPILGKHVSFADSFQLNAAINACRQRGFPVP